MVYRHSYPVIGANTMVYFIHGFGDHAGRYAYFAEFLNDNGISFFAHDLLGFGKSDPVDGMMAYSKKFDDYVDESMNELKRVSSGYDKVVLVGASMGGLVAFRLSHRVKVSGLILCSPLLQLNKNAAPFYELWLPFVLWLFPYLYIPFPMSEPDWFTSDLEVQKASANDPYVWNYTPRAAHAAEQLKIADQSRLLWKEHTTPTHLFHAVDDKVCDFNTSKEFSAACPDVVVMHEMENAGHCLLLEGMQIREKVYSRILAAIGSF